MIAEHCNLASLHHHVHAGARVWTNTDDIPQADDSVGPPRFGIGQNRRQRLEVSMDITDDGNHGDLFGGSRDYIKA